MQVTVTGSCGWRSSSARTIGAAAMLSPTETACADAAGRHLGQGQGKTLADALGIGRCLARAPPQAQRHQRQAEVEQQGIGVRFMGAQLKNSADRLSRWRVGGG